jgi:DNA (cytosine-5)-methyltransferase 1
MQFISLFSGIDGFGLAAEWMGWDVIAQCEIDPFCRKVLKKHWPDVYLHGDIKTLTSEIIKEKSNWDPAKATVLVGGFPCQPFSHAGRRKGTDDERNLWPEYYRLIQELQPTYVAGENVAGLTTMENSTPFEKWLFIGMESKNHLCRIYSRYIYRKRQTFILDEIYKDLEREGYTVESFIIPACGVGAWHRRDRIWILAYLPNTRIKDLRKRENSPNVNGRNKNVPNTDKPGFKAGQLDGSKISGGNPERRNTSNDKSKITFSSKPIPDAKGGRVERSRPDREQITQAQIRSGLSGCDSPRDGGSYRSIKPSVGDLADGIPDGMDGYWDREPDIPRIAKGVKDRVNKLKALGNAVVPQVVYEIFKAIQIHYERF